MEIYTSEEERLEAVQRWWKQNGGSVLTGLALGVIVILGWNMWQGNKTETARQASVVFQQMTQAAGAKQSESAAKLGERLLNQYGSTAYADYARLFLARLKADAGDLAGARKYLEEGLAKTSDEELKHLARLRLGRVLLASGDAEGGLKLIAAFGDAQVGEFKGLYEELRGDLLVAAKRPEEARAAYLKAKEAGEPTPILDLKLNDLPQAPGS